MARIKSAWEIALERTETIEVDADRIRRNASVDTIRRMAGAFLLSDAPNPEKLASDLQAYDPSVVKEALSQTVLNSLVLPADENSFNEEKLRRTSELLSMALPGRQEALVIYTQLCQHLQQYPQHRKQLLDQLKAQYEPMLQQKAEAMKSQYGQEVPVSFEEDKECRQIARQYLDRLSAQYEDVLQKGKESLKALFA